MLDGLFIESCTCFPCRLFLKYNYIILTHTYYQLPEGSFIYWIALLAIVNKIRRDAHLFDLAHQHCEFGINFYCLFQIGYITASNNYIIVWLWLQTKQCQVQNKYFNIIFICLKNIFKRNVIFYFIIPHKLNDVLVSD